MAKSSAKKVAAAPVAVSPAKKSAKKGGKRGGEEAKEKIVNVKKQKLQNDEAVAAKKKVEAKIVKKNKKDESSSLDEAESESDEEPLTAPESAPNKVDESESESGGDESGSDESDDEPQNEANKVDGSEDSSEGESDEESEEEEPVKTSKKKGADVKMADASTPKSKTPAEGEGLKTLFVGNLSFNIEQSDVEEFFKDVGEIVEVRFSYGPEGSFKGFGHVEFASAEACQRALELNGADLSGRQVRLDFARGRDNPMPKGTVPKPEKSSAFEKSSVFVRGFDKNLEEEEARSALQEHFGGCGEITRCSIPTDRVTGDIKGIAYIDFSDNTSIDKALELSGSDLGGCSLYVDMATPLGDSNRRGGFSGGGRGGGRRGRGGGDRGRGGRRGGGRRGGGRGRY